MENELHNFKTIVDHCDDAIYIAHQVESGASKLEIVYANNAFCQKRGSASYDLIGSEAPLMDMLQSDPQALASIQQALADGRLSRVSLDRVKGKRGDRSVDLSLLPLMSQGNQATAFAVIEREVSASEREPKVDEAAPGWDSLTGLYNNHSLHDLLNREYALYLRNQQRFSVLLVEIDHFSAVIDEHGQDASDAVLKQLGKLFKDVFRAHDLAARIGSDQFCLLMHQTSLDRALISAIRFRLAVVQRAFAIGDDAIDLTVSIGVSEVLADDKGSDEILERARLALHEARRIGRDQVQMYTPALAAS